MSLKDALGFEAFNIGHLLKGLKHDPKRLFLGVDPISTKGWNAVLGRNDKPLVNQLGGPTQQTFKDAQAKGINTGTASTLHGIAKAVAGAYGAVGAAGGIGNAAGSLSGAGTAGGAVGTGGGATGGVVGGAGIAGGAAEAIPEVVVTGTAGSGLGAGAGAAAGAGAGAGAAASTNGSNWRDYAQMGQQQDDPNDPQAANRRYMEQMMEQERMRREDFRRNAIARAMTR